MSTATAPAPTLRSDLLKLFRRAKLPTSPALAAQLLELTNDPNSSLDQFARLIEMDGVLAAKLLRMANSVEMAQRTEVTSVPRAVTVLGLNRVRTVALGFQLIGHMDRLGGCPFDIKRFWQLSLLRGCLAREVAAMAVPKFAEEAFLCGLMQDCGILLLVPLLGRDYAELYETGNLSPTAFYAAEKERFPHTHVDAIKVMAEEWGLPQAIAIPVGRHHTMQSAGAEASDTDLLSAVSFLVGGIPLQCNQETAASEPTLLDFSRERLKIDGAGLRKCLETAASAFASVGSVFSQSLPPNLEVADLLSEANRHLTSAAGAAHEESQRVKAAQVSLQSELGEVRAKASRDALTGVLNRGALLEAAAGVMRRAGEAGRGIAVFFLDIDNFKKLNDNFGHAAGDAVLRGIAATLAGLVDQDGCLGRYGGEEFVAVRPCASEAEAQSFAQRIVEQVRAAAFPELKLPGPVTCSVGALLAPAGQGQSVEELFSVADGLMYRAKGGGKDRFCFGLSTALKEEMSASSGKAAAQAVAAAIGEAGEGERLETPAVPAHLRIIAEELNRTTPAAYLNMRKQARKQLIAPCRIRFFSAGRDVLQSETAYVRNISTGGLGLMTSRPFGRCEPLEVAVLANGNVLMYAAGLITFCWQVTSRVHDVGMQLFAHAKHPLFSERPDEVLAKFPWIREALDAVSAMSQQQAEARQAGQGRA